jgi:alpha-beta hydrolase superfamily lysophospholipase
LRRGTILGKYRANRTPQRKIEHVEYHTSTGADGTHLHQWLPPQPRAVLHIVHGMAEHGGRYARLAARLADDGIAVFAQDLPGHGRTPGVQGHFADHNGWRLALDAISGVRAELDQRYPDLPRFMLGHSMGAFLMQHLIVEQGEGLSGVVLSATTGDVGPMRGIGLGLLAIEKALRGPRAASRLGGLLGFSAFNKVFAPNRSDFDWLSRDEAEVDAYIADPLCGFACTTALWSDLLRACAGLSAPARLARVPNSLPLLLVAGEADPVCKGAQGPRRLAEAYRAAGVQQVALRTWPGARHELLNESCRDEVMQTLAAWLRKRAG